MSIEVRIKLFLAVIGLAGFLFGVFEYIQTRAIEARLPYLEKKLKWCEDAVVVASRIAVADAPDPQDEAEFWQLYWGVMGLIEKKPITDAMIAFGDAVRGNIEIAESSKGDDPALQALGPMSLALAHACRSELATEWSTSWTR